MTRRRRAIANSISASGMVVLVREESVPSPIASRDNPSA
ncbi:hypothetical protein SAMN05216552_102091 [Pseudoduganella namucuonensis]|uniref:Uncharacterized protein n=1 Tax=Pseudoduganella namucuonensis TaxID=1035707 RepID=A0A1I7KWL6_9BURK|nr:hypothetical protein SAMN05216552_102091 [Pseudoduganella namucuonensis]